MKGRLLLGVGVACLMSLGSGCEFLGLDSAPTNEAPAEQQEESEGPSAANLEAAAAGEVEDGEEAYERPIYPGNIRRNPFTPDPTVVSPLQQVVTGEVRPLEPLERYELGSLSLVAIISETALPKAMFVDPTGFGHVVKEGDRVGQNGGEIADIRDNEVEIREAGDGEGVQTRLTTVELRAEELSTPDRGGLTEEERSALRRLLETEEGRRALEESFRERAPGADAADRQEAGGGSSDGRFGGIRPPGR